jgi:cell division protein FtsB
LQKQIDTLRSDNENLKSTMKSLRTQLNDVEAGLSIGVLRGRSFSRCNCSLSERDDLLIKSTDVSNLKVNDDLLRQLDKEKAENEQQRIELAKLRQMLSERDAIIEEQDRRLLIDHETQATQTVRGTYG